jgi:hypothetical protein
MHRAKWGCIAAATARDGIHDEFCRIMMMLTGSSGWPADGVQDPDRTRIIAKTAELERVEDDGLNAASW